MFKDRLEAGRKLSYLLQRYKDQEDVLVMALPRGGVIPAFMIAKQLHLPLEVIMIKKLGHPYNPEYAIGAVGLKETKVDRNTDVDKQYIEDTAKEIRDELKQRYKLYYGTKKLPSLKNKTLIVVDDGVATGRTLMAALEQVRLAHPKRIVVAVPVLPHGKLSHLKTLADEVIYLENPWHLNAVGSYYFDFGEVTDEDVIELLKKSEETLHSGSGLVQNLKTVNLE